MAAVIPLTLLASCQELRGLDDRLSKNARAKACEFLDIHIHLSRPVDLGNGIAGQYEYGPSNLVEFEKFPLSGGWKATQCSSGQQILVDVLDNGEFSKQAEEVQNATLENFLELAESQGFATHNSQETGEACGCAAFYPKLLGDKKPAFQRDRMPAWSEL